MRRTLLALLGLVSALALASACTGPAGSAGSGGTSATSATSATSSGSAPATAATPATAQPGTARSAAQSAAAYARVARLGRQEARQARRHQALIARLARQHARRAARLRRVRHNLPCAHNSDAQQAIVSVARQHMWMCARHHLVHQSAVTTGMVGQYTGTPTGDYWIQGRTSGTTLTLNTGQTYAVRYWIPFDAPLFGFHDSPWQTMRYGSQRYRTQGSHGCVHMPLKAIAWFYRWVANPTAVHIS